MADLTYTLTNARKAVLINPEKHNGFNVKYNIPYSDVVAAGATSGDTTGTVSVTLGATPAKWAVTAAAINVKTAYAGVTSQAMTASVGTSGGDVAWAVPATSVFAAGLKTATGGANAVTNIANAQGTSSSTLIAKFTNSAAGSASTLTAGDLDVYLRVLDLSQLG